jgi:hypothetical protein
MLVLLSQIDQRSWGGAGLELTGQVGHPLIEQPHLGHPVRQLLALRDEERLQ